MTETEMDVLLCGKKQFRNKKGYMNDESWDEE